MDHFDVNEIRKDFPILNRKVHDDKPLVFLDSTASSQKPRQVLEAMNRCYQEYYANIHRGVYEISQRGTKEYGLAKKKVAAFIHARGTKLSDEDGHEEIIFTRNTTESINLVAKTWGRQNIRKGDEIITSVMEHHSNMVPWQELAKENGATIHYIDIDEQGILRLDEFQKHLSRKTKIVAITHMSNVLGTINPVKEIGKMAHSVGAMYLVDGAQSVPHIPVDVQDIDCDFLAFSAHKMLGPSGIGVLYGKKELLEEMPPFLHGGDMISQVTLEGAKWNKLPWKFEAGTPAIVEGIGLGAAIDYLQDIGMANIERYEQEIIQYALEALSEVKGIKVYGPPPQFKGGIATFTLSMDADVSSIHPEDIGYSLDSEGICIRTGLHCAHPLHDRLGLRQGTARASFYLYTTRDEVDKLVAALHMVNNRFHNT